MNAEFHTPFEWLYVDVQYIQNLDRRDLWHTKQKSLFLCDYWTKLYGVFVGKIQIISYSFHNPKAYSGLCTILKVIDAESPLVIMGGTVSSMQKVKAISIILMTSELPASFDELIVKLECEKRFWKLSQILLQNTLIVK